MNNPFQIVRAEAFKAYADRFPDMSQEQFEKSFDIRQLDWRASLPLMVTEAIQIMEEVCPSYNLFEPSLLRHLPAVAEVTLARDGSVCIYVKNVRPNLREVMFATEWKKVGEEIRIWWD